MAYSAIDLARGSIGGGTKILVVVGYEGRLLLVHSLWNKSIALNWDMRRSLVENFVVGNSAAEILLLSTALGVVMVVGWTKTTTP